MEDGKTAIYVSSPSVTIATSLFRSTENFLKSLSHMFSYDQFKKFSEVKYDLIPEIAP